MSQARAVASVLSPLEGGHTVWAPSGQCRLTSKLGKEKVGWGMQFYRFNRVHVLAGGWLPGSSGGAILPL